jgi:hypothetical protein
VVRVLLWYIFLSFVIGACIYIISEYINKDHLLVKQLKESEKNYQDLAQKYDLLESKTLNLEKQILEETAKNSEKDSVLIEHLSHAEIKEMATNIEESLSQSLNSLSILIQDVKEAHEFREIDDQYIDSFTRESMLQIKQMSRSMHDFRKIYKPNEQKILS